jgi:type II secretory pathway pseudopilin PulG
MDNTTRAFYESRFDHDFTQVRLHTDERAAESARGLNARAFTLGKDVTFGEGQYAPGTLDGRRLLAHELTHVVQQRNAGLSAQTIQSKNVQKNNYIKDIYVNLTSQTVNWKYDDGTESDTYECSTGTGLCKSDCSSPNTSGSACTPVGSFKVCSRTTHAHYKYWIGFDCARAIAFHYHSDVDGCPWSHGCVRLHLEAVKLIYQGARKDYTMVHVSGTPKIRRCWTSSTAGTCRIRGTKKACKRNDCHELGDFPVPDVSERANRFA